MACPESSSGIFRRTQGKATEETRFNRGYERMGCLFSFAQTAFHRSASVRPIAAKASGMPLRI
jgi:hypothetical protein